VLLPKQIITYVGIAHQKKKKKKIKKSYMDGYGKRNEHITISADLRGQAKGEKVLGEL
jgi:hypothetical protein